MSGSGNGVSSLPGHKPGFYIALTIILWVGLEFGGAIIGVFAMEDELLVYAFAILGGALGALLSFLIAKNAKDITAMAVGNEDVLDAGL